MNHNATPPLLALIPPLCRLTSAPPIHATLSALHAPAPLGPLLDQCRAVSPADAALVDRHLPALPADEALALFHLCSQCTAAELLAVAADHPTLPPDALALLVGDRRRHDAMARYALQLLWRILADPAIPDALSLFPPDATPARPADAIAADLLDRLSHP